MFCRDSPTARGICDLATASDAEDTQPDRRHHTRRLATCRRREPGCGCGVPAGEGSAARARQLRAPSRRGRGARRHADPALRRGADARDEPRRSSGVDGEQVWPLRSLPVGPSTELFVERARAVKPAFALESGSVAPVAEICGRLDGMPLAIELAAARVVSMSPLEIAERLDERFRLLTGGRRSAVERHQTLRATVDWSYSLLDDRVNDWCSIVSVCSSAVSTRTPR